MGSYADSLLTEGETVIRRERQHWLSLFLESRAVDPAVGHRILRVDHHRPVARPERRRQQTASASAPSRSSSLGADLLRLPLVALADRRVRHHQPPAAQGRRASSTSAPATPTWRRSTTRSWRRTSSAGSWTTATWNPDRGGGVGRPLPDAQPRQDVQEADDDRQARARGRPFATATSPSAPAARDHADRAAPATAHRRTRPTTERADTRRGGRPVARPGSRRCVTRGPSPTRTTTPRSRSCWAGCRPVAPWSSSDRPDLRPARGGHHAARRVPGPRVLPRLRGVSAGRLHGALAGPPDPRTRASTSTRSAA